MKLLLTGGAGFIGSRLIERWQLEFPNSQITVIDDLSKGKRENVPEEILFIEADLAISNILETLEHHDIVVHFCGQSSGERSFQDPFKDAMSNYVASVNVMNYVNRVIPKSLIFSSSMSIYGENNAGPQTPYAFNKLSAENYFIKFNNAITDLKVLRLNNVYGPGQNMDDMKQGMASIFLSQALKTDKIIVKGSLDRTRDFVWIYDVCDLVISVLLSPSDSGHAVLDVASSDLVSVRRLLDVIQENLGKRKIFSESGTPGDQFNVNRYDDIFKVHLKRDSVKIEQGLKKWIKEIKD
jgi:UDP-glucose 4-epimerase